MTDKKRDMPSSGKGHHNRPANKPKFNKNTILDQYLKHRRQDPTTPPHPNLFNERSCFGVLKPELEKCGIEVTIVSSALRGDVAAISELSLQTMERIVKRENRAKSGDSHLVGRKSAISDKLVSWIIAASLEALAECGPTPIPQDLIILIRIQLGNFASEYRNLVIEDVQRFFALNIGARLLADGKRPSLKAVAEELGVEASTVLRWFPNGDKFQELVKEFLQTTRQGSPNPRA